MKVVRCEPQNSVNISKLTDYALDWAVATCSQLPVRCDPMAFGLRSPNGGYWVWHEKSSDGQCQKIGTEYSPSTKPGQGHHIIETHIHNLFRTRSESGEVTWHAVIQTARGDFITHGATALIASMRAYVASVMGEEIELPEGLLD